MSDQDFAKTGGDALQIGDEFDSEEEADEMPESSNDAMRQPMNAAASKAAGAGASK